MIGRLTGIVMVALTLASCAAHMPRENTMDPAEVKLAEAASDVSHSLVQLAAIEQSANPQAPVNPPPDPSSYGMGSLVSIDWSGPIAPLVARIAKASGYRLEIMGRQPAIPIMVTMVAHNTPIGDVLRDCGFQAGSRADIVVFPSRRIVELRYAPA